MTHVFFVSTVFSEGPSGAFPTAEAAKESLEGHLNRRSLRWMWCWDTIYYRDEQEEWADFASVSRVPFFQEGERVGY